MKNLTLALMLLTPFLTTAEDIGFEIPSEPGDVRLSDGAYDHTSTYVKKISCLGQPHAIVYKTILGYSTGSRLIAVCALAKATSAESCIADESPNAKTCYDYTVAFYHLERKHPMKSDFERIQTTPPEIEAEPAAAR